MREKYHKNVKRERRLPGDPPLPSDEFRTPGVLGEAMALAAGVKEFALDPFAPFHGFSGIPAAERVHWKQDIYKYTPPSPPSSIGANIPFGEARKALPRIQELAGDTTDVPVVTIVRAAPFEKWWFDHIVRASFYSWCVFTPRIKFYDMIGQETTKTPTGGVAVVGRNADRDAVYQCVKEHWGNAMAVWI